MAEGWKVETFSCFDDLPTCLYGYFCSPCMYFNSASKLGQCGKYFALACCCPVCAMAAMKTEVREKYNIEGDKCNDCLMGWLFGACTNCQIYRELETRGAY